MQANPINRPVETHSVRPHPARNARARVRALSVALSTAILLLAALGAAGAQAAFTITEFDGSVSNRDGSPASQAGLHPFQILTTIGLSSKTEEFGLTIPDEPPKDIDVELPAGFLGNPTAVPTCTIAQLGSSRGCPVASQVGVIGISPITGEANGYEWNLLYNMAPPPGHPAAFGFAIQGVTVTLLASVRSGSDYGVTFESNDIPETVPLHSTKVIVWGVPADPSHDVLRGQCLEAGFEGIGSEPKSFCEGGTQQPVSAGASPRPFLRNPTSCTPEGVGLRTSVTVASWAGVQQAASYFSHEPEPNRAVQVGSTGCAAVPFQPSARLLPDTTSADAPSGLLFDLGMPQGEDPLALAQADVRDVTVRLPEGMGLSPSAASGMGACDDAQFALRSSATPTCPANSKIGTVTITTPDLPAPLAGALYVGSQQSSDPASGRMYRLLLFAQAPVQGVLVKLEGAVHADPRTGQLTTVFADNPQLPFSDMQLRLTGGPRAPLSTPAGCGTVAADVRLQSWSGSTAEVESPFTIGSGGAAPCSPTAPFAPALTAGAVNPQAGAFSPFTLTLSRADREQPLSGVSAELPAGLAAVVKGVPRCPDADAAAGTCGEACLLGPAPGAGGAGADPLYVSGKAYLTGPYHGAPFGLSIAVPAIAGPFDLGTVVVRAAVSVDPHTAQVTVASDPLPQVVGGVRTRTRLVNVTIDRPGFMFNPTECASQHVTANVSGAQGASASLSVPFQAVDCASLRFDPSLTAVVAARHSRADGASLRVLVTSGPGQSNIGYVRVTLPKSLPSRLDTLRGACPATVFDANPAACPSGSRVGSAVAQTPVLGTPLAGPVYFVSHGGAAFPDMVAVLQGEGVTVDLVGNTAIKRGVTSTVFASVPDVPVSRFQMMLPAGPHSALAANGNLCKQRRKLWMSLVIKGQNATRIVRRSKIVVAGCVTRAPRKKK